MLFRFRRRINNFRYVGRIFVDILDQSNVIVFSSRLLFGFHLGTGISVCSEIHLSMIRLNNTSFR
jgi:hypothetical protein